MKSIFFHLNRDFYWNFSLINSNIVEFDLFCFFPFVWNNTLNIYVKSLNSNLVNVLVTFYTTFGDWAIIKHSFHILIFKCVLFFLENVFRSQPISHIFSNFKSQKTLHVWQINPQSIILHFSSIFRRLKTSKHIYNFTCMIC